MFAAKAILDDHDSEEILLDREFNVTKENDLDFYYVYDCKDRTSYVMQYRKDYEEIMPNKDMSVHLKICYGLIRCGYEL